MNRAIHGAPAQALCHALEAPAKLAGWVSWTADPDLGLRPGAHASARCMREAAADLRKAARQLDAAADLTEVADRDPPAPPPLQ